VGSATAAGQGPHWDTSMDLDLLTSDDFFTSLPNLDPFLMSSSDVQEHHLNMVISSEDEEIVAPPTKIVKVFDREMNEISPRLRRGMSETDRVAQTRLRQLGGACTKHRTTKKACHCPSTNTDPRSFTGTKRTVPIRARELRIHSQHPVSNNTSKALREKIGNENPTVQALSAELPGFQSQTNPVAVIEERITAYHTLSGGQTKQPRSRTNSSRLFRCHFVVQPCDFVTDDFLELAQHQHW